MKKYKKKNISVNLKITKNKSQSKHVEKRQKNSSPSLVKFGFYHPNINISVESAHVRQISFTTNLDSTFCLSLSTTKKDKNQQFYFLQVNTQKKRTNWDYSRALWKQVFHRKPSINFSLTLINRNGTETSFRFMLSWF